MRAQFATQDSQARFLNQTQGTFGKAFEPQFFMEHGCTHDRVFHGKHFREDVLDAYLFDTPQQA